MHVYTSADIMLQNMSILMPLSILWALAILTIEGA